MLPASAAGSVETHNIVKEDGTVVSFVQQIKRTCGEAGQRCCDGAKPCSLNSVCEDYDYGTALSGKYCCKLFYLIFY